MHYSKENIREANRLCIDICVIKKGGKRVGNYNRGESLLEGLSRYLKYMVSQAIRISGRIILQDKGTVVESRVKACLVYSGNSGMKHVTE